MSNDDFVNFYDLLRVPQTATADVIRRAVTAQRRLWVKRQASADPARRAEAETRVRDIDRAEKVLLDAAARAAFDREVASYRPPSAATPMPDGGNWLERARVYLRDDNPGAANYAAREAINQGGSNHEAWFIRAHSSFLLGNGSDAEYEFTEAIRLKPDNPLYYYGFGEAQAAQEKWRSALTAYERALQLDPGNPEYLTSIAQVYLANELPAKAVEIMEGVVKSHPENEVFKYYLAIAMHDQALDSLGKVRPLAYEGRLVDSGGWTILSEAQVSLVERTVRRIAGLKASHPDIAALTAELTRMVEEARKTYWNLSGSSRWLVAFLAFGLIPFLVGMSQGSGALAFGFIAGFLIVTLFIATKRMPGWKYRLRVLGEAGRLEQRGI